MNKGSDMVNGGFIAIVGSIYQQGIAEIITWLIAMSFVVLADLCTGVRKAYLMGEHLRWSKGMRDTMSKLITYYAFVVGAVMVDIASGKDIIIAKYACLAVCAIELLSIMGNLLKPHGININLANLFKVVGKKVAKVELDKVITEDKEGASKDE